ncbi:DEAD/DEAH box helicase [Agromyces sp. Leaf222]|uniref:DEAD/DEAH box helicase n=1 Tax=Agromyces sp. Leaf222 TaxID=1735688 RepID=UPI000A91A6F6|nr:helicase-related protein [Agromyces sp. Leaf222]
MDWQTGDDALQEYVRERQATALRTYEVNPDLLEEHVGQEDSFRSGGYGQRQISELLQNAVDALTESGTSGTVEFRLADGNLYCANQGMPFGEKGIRAVCAAFLSPKRDEDIIGRFGLGFKSVLGVSDHPQIFSRSVSFEFNAPATAELFAGMHVPGGRLPLMRVPSLIDVDGAIASDPNLAEMMTWATTVIKLPLMRDGARIRADLHAFSTETLLFMKSVAQLNITLTGKDGVPATQTHRREGDLASGEVVLHRPDGAPTTWLFAERRYEPSEAVLKSLTATMARRSMTVSYAVPKSGSTNPLGQLWAWFPLNDQTTARGIFNAPWQVNDDRTTLLASSALNSEMLEVCAELFIDVVARASTAEDPAAHLDLFPARGREIRSNADRHLSEAIPRLARNRELIPDADGVLRGRGYFKGVPVLEAPIIPAGAMKAWQTLVERRTIPHHMAFAPGRDRPTRLRALLRLEDGEKSASEVPVSTWLEELVAARTHQTVGAALHLYIGLRNAGFPVDLIGPSRLVPLADGSWARVGETRSVLMSRPGEPTPEGVLLVDDALLNEKIRELLVQIGFGEVSADLTAEAIATRASRSWGDDDWRRLWRTLQLATPARAAELLHGIRERGLTVRVENREGRWRDAHEVFASELTIPSLEARHASESLARRKDLLQAAGCLAEPDPEFPLHEEPLYAEYRVRIANQVAESIAAQGRTAGEVVVPDIRGAGPLQILRELADNERGLADWTSAILKSMPSKTAIMRISMIKPVQTMEADIPSPDWWAIQRFGLLPTSQGFQRVENAASNALRPYSEFIPVVQADLGMYLVDAARSLDRVKAAALGAFLERSGYQVATPDRFTEVLLEASSRREFAAPSTIPALSRGSVAIRPRTDVVVAASSEDIALLDEHGVAYVDGTVAGADQLMERWGLRTSEEALSRSLEIRESGNESYLVDRYPTLAEKSAIPLGRLRLRTSPGIVRKTTSPSGELQTRELSARMDDIVYVDDSLADEEILAEVSRRLGLNLTHRDILDVLRGDEAKRQSELILKVRAAATDTERLHYLFGPAILRDALPKGLLEAVESRNGRQSDLEIAELFWRVRGFDSLWSLRDKLADLNLLVPREWTGSDQAQAFVVSLGFAPGYAGTKAVNRPALQQVQGRLDLKPLHGFQEIVAERIRSLTLETGENGDIQRGLLYLPTGAGKTRVTVESVVRMFVANELTGPVLWIAQSQELCEQAIATWTDAWRAFGDERVLDINRYWGNYEVDESNEELQIVVATDDKLRSRIDSDPGGNAWLAEASLVIIDEAHTAMSQTYTRILRWLGLTAAKTERPLLGLTATPYRGRNEEVNRLFVQRFGKNKLESLDPDDPIGQLRREKVLAEVDHHILDGMTVRFSTSDWSDTFKDITKSMLDHIGQDMSRTQNVVDDILSQPEDWPILVFAASVSSAHTIAALLRLQGKRAEAVDGNMRPQERRRIIEGFRAGETQILVNCDLLTQGFDAPKVRALYIARPTFSPNRYHQMIGRGLRGPENGGKERCLIVNVADTFEEFGEELAFTEFNYLWETR